MNRLALGISLLASLALFADDAPTGFQDDFQKGEVGKISDQYLVLDGNFSVKEENGNKFLELPGEPLDTFGVMFGPAQSAPYYVQARIQATTRGRRYPTFAVGANGNGGYKLQLAPAKKDTELELLKGDDILTNAPFAWNSGSWTWLRLQIEPSGGNWKILGKVWGEKEKEPEKWQIDYTEKTKPSTGRASVWGKPFSGTPIHFDDLSVKAVGK